MMLKEMLTQSVETAKLSGVTACVGLPVNHSVSPKALAAAIVVCIGLAGLFPFHVAADSGTTYYLHAPECQMAVSGYLPMDGQQPEGTTCSIIEAGGNATVWATSPFTKATVFSAGDWNVSLWLSTNGTVTQYNLTLAIVDSAGNLTQIGTGFSPDINSTSSAQYFVEVPASTNATLNVGDSLTLWMVNQDEYGNPTDPGFVFLDSATTPSQLTAPTPASNITTQFQSVTTAASITQTNSTETQPNMTTEQSLTTTTPQLTISQALATLSQLTTSTVQPALTTETQNSSSSLGWALAIVGVGTGVALLLGLFAFRSSSKAGQIIVRAGRYYCTKHHAPLLNAYGAFWCPFERTPLKP